MVIYIVIYILKECTSTCLFHRGQFTSYILY